MLASVEVMGLHRKELKERTNDCLRFSSLETIQDGNFLFKLLTNLFRRRRVGEAGQCRERKLSKNMVSDRAQFQINLIGKPETAMYQSWPHLEARRLAFYIPSPIRELLAADYLGKGVEPDFQQWLFIQASVQRRGSV